MFWTNNTPSPIETILSKEDVSLQEVMDDEDILNDCKVQNKVLIDYLMKKEVLGELVSLTVDEPSSDADDMVRYKYSNIACEILTSDISALSERLAGDADLLSKLYSFLNTDGPLNPLLASFFSKVMIMLIAKTTQHNWLSYQFTSLQVLDFLKAQQNFLPQLLKHLNTSAIMDLTLKLMTAVEDSERKLNILKWLDEQGFMQSLIGLLKESEGQDRHFNVAQLLCDFIKISRDNLRSKDNSAEKKEDPLLETLEKPKTVSLLLDQILSEEKCDSAIIAGIQILITLLDINASNIPNVMQYAMAFDDDNSEEDRNRQAIIDQIKREVVLRLKDFHGLLITPPKNVALAAYLPPPSAITPAPFGNARLHVVRLLVVLVRSPCDPLPQTLVHLDVARTLLDLFFAHPWNNFLHAQVEAFVAAALTCNGDGGVPSTVIETSPAGGSGEDGTGENTPAPAPAPLILENSVANGKGDHNALSKHLLLNCNLIERILSAWKLNDEKQRETNGRRQGYMGHLINILNNVVNVCIDSKLGEFLRDNKPEVKESLEQFKDTTLKETNDVQNILLGGVGPNQANDGSEGVFDYNEVYADFQVQQLSPQLVEGFAFNDDDYKDGNSLQNIEHRGTLNFDLSEGELMRQQQELFKQVCGQNISTLDDADDQIFSEEREHDTFQTVIEKAVDAGVGKSTEDAFLAVDGEGGEVGGIRRRRRNRNSSSSSSSGSASSEEAEEEEEEQDGLEKTSIAADSWASNKLSRHRVLASAPAPSTLNNENPWAGVPSSNPFASAVTDNNSLSSTSAEGWANFTAAFNETFEPIAAPAMVTTAPVTGGEETSLSAAIEAATQNMAKVKVDAGDLVLENVEPEFEAAFPNTLASSEGDIMAGELKKEHEKPAHKDDAIKVVPIIEQTDSKEPIVASEQQQLQQLQQQPQPLEQNEVKESV